MAARILLLLLLVSIVPARSGVIISEFMADNAGQLRDQDGESPDWIELRNDSTNTVNLLGWHLTDEQINLTKWTFPATNLPPGGHLFVFASAKNRAVAGRELHTNFQLDAGGGYLALVGPDGMSVASAFNPFPRQRFDVSYGLAQQTSITPLILTGAAVQVLVPSNGTLGLTWTSPAFDDSAWLATNTPVGFSVGTVGTTVIALDVNERGQSAAATTQSGFTSFVINSNGSSLTIQTQATTRAFGGITITVSNTAPYGYDDRLRTTPSDNGAFTESLLLRDFIFSRDDTGNGGLDVTISGLETNRAHRLTVWSYDTSSTGNRVSDWFANGVAVINGYTFNGLTLPTSNDQYRFTFDTTASGDGTILLSGRRDSASATFGVFLNALKVERLSPAPGTNNLALLMLSNNATAYIRIPFTVADPNGFQTLKLRMKYDDGFAAYLNGQLVASRNAPASPQWNSAATASRSDTDNLLYEDIFIANVPGLLADGPNVLAIHGLNVSASDSDFLVQAELEGIVGGQYSLRYFRPPTPGAVNDSGYLGLVADTKFSADRGFYDAPFTVAITSATASASIYWTTNGSIPSPTNGTLYAGAVPIAGTTLLRAAAFLNGHVSSVPDAQSYFFLNQVLQQPNALPGYPTVWQASYPADYEMDPNVVNHSNYGATISNDLRSIPTVSIVTDHDSLWNPSTGIYVDAQDAGELSERAASVELFNGDNTSEFQINCGLRMQGNASRDNTRLAKHSFRLRFNSDYGPSKLNYNWFPGPVDRFDNIVLRACFTDSWATRYSDLTPIPGGTGTRYRPEDSLYLRDIWVKDCLRDMGHLSSRNSFVHLYLNGLYWGLYNPTERLDASFFAQHLGGYEQDWDVIRDFGELLDGSKNDWNQMMALANAGVSSEAAYQAIGQLVDIENLIDYMLLHIFAEAEDWPSHNWYAAHRRANPTNGLPATKWIFLAWDQEIVLDQLVRRNRISVSDNDTPARIYSQLRAWPEFRRLFGDRIQKHLFNNGALTPSNNVARLQARAAQIDRAIVGESARWGDAREFTIGPNPGHGQTFTRDEWWVPELQKLYTNFLQTLNATNIARFRAGNLYPNLGAPQFSQFGGNVPAGFALAMTHTNASGVIYFTLDGTDPRVYGSGSVAPGAQAYGGPVPINSTTFVRARVFDGANWSALVEAAFAPPQDLNTLAMTEVMYSPPAFGVYSGADLEFIEFKNVGTNTLNLSGLTFSEGIAFTFTNGTLLPPAQFFVLARNATAFAQKYPGVNIKGIFGGQLNNGGETVSLALPNGSNIFSLTFDDETPWPAAADGYSFSLVPKQPGLAQAPDNGSKWRASALPGGSPGADDPEPNIPPIVINEILAHTDPPQRDAIELFNPTGTNVDVSGWFLTDDPSAPTKYRWPSNSIVSAAGHLVVDESQFNLATNGNVPFLLSSEGEQVYLFSATNGQLTGYSHGVTFGASFNGVSFGRHINSAGEELFPLQISRTPGQSNSGPRIGPIVINEIHYHPAGSNDEFIELLNIADHPVPLFHTNYPGNIWKLGGASYTFPPNVTLEAGELLLVVARDPAEFRAQYNIPAGTQILGPFAGVLQDSGELLSLLAPDTPNTNGVPYVAVEEVRYNDKAPWPPEPDGSGASLQRRSAFAFGNEPTNWVAGAPSPGRLSDFADSDGDGLPDSWEVSHGTNWKMLDAEDDPDGDGIKNLWEFQLGSDPQMPQDRSRFSIERVSGSSGEDLIVFEFIQLPEFDYTIEMTPTVSPPAWTEWLTLPAAGNAGVVSLTNPVLAANAHFYRLKIQSH